MSDDKLNLIFERRSVRVYSPGEISPEQVKKLLEAAMAAPSAMGKDPWRFVVIRQREQLAALPAILPGGKMLASATLAIAVCGDLEAACDSNLSYLLQDCAAATENLLLCAHGLGLGACWVGVHPSEPAVKGLRQALGLPGNFIPVAVVSLGRPGEELPARTRYNEAFVRWDHWA